MEINTNIATEDLTTANQIGFLNCSQTGSRP